MKHYLSSISTKTFLLFTTLVLLLSGGLPAFASAAQLTQAGLQLGRLAINAGTGNDLLVTFKLNTTATTVAKIDIVFPVGFTIATGTPTVGTGTYPNTPASITAPPGTLTAASTAVTNDILVSGFTSASLTNTTLYGFTIPAGTITNPATAGAQNITVCSEPSGGTANCGSAIDTTTVQTYIYGAGANGDQVTVNASVAANFSFALSANSDTIPKIDPSAPQTSAGVTMTVSTNSPLGYTAYVKSKNSALTSATSPSTPINTGAFNGAPDLMSGGSSIYGFVPSTTTAGGTVSGSISYDTEYNAIDGTHGGAFNGTSFASFQSRNGYSSGDQISLKERATVANTVAAANDYTDTLTVVAAGNF